MILRPAFLALLVALAAPLASATVGTNALQAESLSINNVAITEGDAGAVAATFTVTLSDVSPDTVTVDYATADGTAVAPGDYSAAGGTLTFPPGEITQTVTVDVNGDALAEEDETYAVDLTNAVNGTIDDGQGVGTITDDDPLVAISLDDGSVVEGNFGVVSATFNVSLSSASGRSVSVDYASANGTATAPVDYLSATGTLDFAAGETTKQVTVLVNGDLLDEANETFFLNLTNAANATIADGQGLGTITDDDGPPSLSVNDVTVTEGDSGTTSATFTVTLAPASGQNVSVDYSTADGTATAPADYAATSGTLTFAPGQTTQTVTVQVAGDTLDEIDETFTVNLSNAVNATIADGTGLGTILDDDPLPALSINDVTVTEPDTGTTSATFTVSLNAPSAPCGLGRLRDRGRHGDCAGGLRRRLRQRQLRGRRDDEAGDRARQRRPARRGERDLLRQPHEPDERDDRRRPGHWARSRTTTRCRRSRSTTSRSSRATRARSTATFTVTLNASSGRSVTVDYATANGTAMAPADYRPRPARSPSRPARRRSSHRPRQRRHARRGERDLLRQPLEPGERDDRGRPGCRHDHGRRRRCPRSPSTTWPSPRVTRETMNARFTVTLDAASGRSRVGRLRDRERNGTGAGRLPAAHRDAHLRGRGNVQDWSPSRSGAT